MRHTNSLFLLFVCFLFVFVLIGGWVGLLPLGLPMNGISSDGIPRSSSSSSISSAPPPHPGSPSATTVTSPPSSTASSLPTSLSLSSSLSAGSLAEAKRISDLEAEVRALNEQKTRIIDSVSKKVSLYIDACLLAHC
jgi:hypothetical protein